MRKNSPVTTLFRLLAFLLLFGGQAAGSDARRIDGDGTIHGEETVRGERIRLDGSLVLLEEAKLILEDCTLEIVGDYPLRSVRTARFRYVRNVKPELSFTTQTDHNPGAESFIMWEAWVARAKVDPAVAAELRLYHHRSAEELYDLQNDPHEQHHLAADPAHALNLAELRESVDDWVRQSGDTSQLHGKPVEVLLPVKP